MKYLLSIIIVNWNVADLLMNAIQSILDNPPPGDYEIIVVDNASSDDSLENLKNNFPMVKVIANKDNVGFGKANNQGMGIAEGEYILLLNPDTVVIEDAIGKLIKFLENNPDIGMVGPQLLNKAGSEPQQGGAKLSRTFISGVMLDLLYVNRIPWIGPRIAKALRYPYDLYKEGYVEVISGSAMIFKNSTIKRIGGFDERFFMAGEDVELCDRFWQNGYKVYYFPIARIIHLNQSCTPLNPVYIFVNRFLSVAKYYEHKYGKWTHDCFRSATFLILIPKLLIKIVFYVIVNDQEKRKMNKAILSLLVKWRFVGDAGGFN